MTEDRARRPITNTRIATIERPDPDTMMLKTFWSPLPTWIYGTVLGAFLALVGVVVGLVSGAEGSDIQNIALFAALIGYIGGAVGWAIVGLFGGDVQRITFDKKEDIARVHQELLWIWRRKWTFELDEIYRMHIWQKRGRFVFKLSTTEVVDLIFINDEDSAKLPNLNLGNYPTELEGADIGKQVAEFLDVPVSRDPPKG